MATAISVFSLVISATALLFTYLTGPFSRFGQPQLRYWFRAENTGKGDDNRHHATLEAEIVNVSRFAAEDVFVNIKIPNDATVESLNCDVPFEIENQESRLLILRLKLLPGTATSAIELHVSMEDDLPYGIESDVPVIVFTSFKCSPEIVSVYTKHGAQTKDAARCKNIAAPDHPHLSPIWSLANAGQHEMA